MSKKPSKRKANWKWGTGSAIFMTALVGLFVLVGTPAIVQGILRLLPTTAVPVEIVGSDSRESGGVGARSGMTYFVTIRNANGEERELTAPAKLHQRANGPTSLSDVQVHITRPIGHPVAVSIAKKSIIQPGSILDKIIYPDKETKNSESIAENRQHYSLLTPLTGLLIAGVFCWSIVGLMLWKLPGKDVFPWPILIVGVLLAAAIGTWWALAG